MTLVNSYLYILNLSVNVRIAGSLKSKIKLKKIFKFIYVAKTFCANKSYAAKNFRNYRWMLMISYKLVKSLMKSG
jgi:hypothetical protein